MLDLRTIPIFDHHAHPLLPAEATAVPQTFQRWFTESSDPLVHKRDTPHSLFLRSGVRWLAEFLDCEATLEAVLEARGQRPYTQWINALFKDARIEHVLCDYGYLSDDGYDAEKMQAVLPCPVQPILRIESLAEKLICEQAAFFTFVEAFQEALSKAQAEGIVAFKSIVAYRSGLEVKRPSTRDAHDAFNRLKEIANCSDNVRLDDKPLNDFLLGIMVEEAAQQQMPIQFHTGFGDQDADLRTANPLELRSLIEQTDAPLVLLHAGWPYYRELAHLTAVYPHVYIDLSLAIPFATTGIPTMLREILGMTPLNKILFATDAFTMPEIYWLAARWGRWGLSKVLTEFVAEGFLTQPEALHTAEAILFANARDLYQQK